MQLKSADDADAFLQNFESPYSGRFWDSDYSEVFSKMLAAPEGGTFNAWNAGCGKGEEAYSITVNLKKKFPAVKIKVFANDSDLLKISTAPNLVFARNTIPDLYDDYITEGQNGWHFISEIKDLILFEYHDVTNNNQFPPVDLIVARDVLSYMSAVDQQKMIDVFYEKLKPGGILIPGANEMISANGWEAINDSRIPAFRKS